MDVNVEIEEIILSGIDLSPAQAELVKSTLSTELAALFTESRRDRWQQHGGLAADDVKGDPINIGTTVQPVQVGEQLAASVFQAVTGSAMYSQKSATHSSTTNLNRGQ